LASGVNDLQQHLALPSELLLVGNRHAGGFHERGLQVAKQVFALLDEFFLTTDRYHHRFA
jgi:hypothetical protein